MSDIQQPKMQIQANGKRAIATAKRTKLSSIDMLAIAHAQSIARKYSGSRGKPKMSAVLKVIKVPQIANHLTSEEGMCVLGALANRSGLTMNTFMTSPEKMISEYDATVAEFNQPVTCPHEGCTKRSNLFWTLPHLNDVHNYTFAQIGEYLEKYNL